MPIDWFIKNLEPGNAGIATAEACRKIAEILDEANSKRMVNK